MSLFLSISISMSLIQATLISQLNFNNQFLISTSALLQTIVHSVSGVIVKKHTWSHYHPLSNTWLPFALKMKIKITNKNSHSCIFWLLEISLAVSYTILLYSPTTIVFKSDILLPMALCIYRSLCLECSSPPSSPFPLLILNHPLNFSFFIISIRKDSLIYSKLG